MTLLHDNQVSRNTHSMGSTGKLFWFVMLVGLLLRLIALYMTKNTDLAIVDEQHYYQLAHSLWRGEGYARESIGLTSMRPPLYAFLVTGIWLITGTESIVLIRAVQILLHLANVFLLYRLGLRLFEPRIALWAAACFWLYPSFIVFNFLFLTEVLFTLLLTLLALCYVNLLRAPRVATAVGMGGVLGLAALTRSVLWPFPVLFCPLTFFSLSGPWKRRLWVVLSLLVGYVVVLTPWAVRNTKLQGVVSIVDTMGGLNLWMGNYPHTPLYRAWDAISLSGKEHWAYTLQQDHPEVRTWTEGQKEKWALRQALHYIVAHPMLTLHRGLIKFADFWGLERTILATWQHGLYHPPPWLTVLGALTIVPAYIATMLLASLGLCLAPPRDRRVHIFFLVVIGFMCGLHTLTFGHSRYHLPLIPFLLLYAVAAVSQRSWLQLRQGIAAAFVPVVMWLTLLIMWGYEVVFIEADQLKAFFRLFFS